MTTYERIKKLKFIAQGLVTYLPFKVPLLPAHRDQFIEKHVREITDYRLMASAAYTVFLRLLVATGRPVPKNVAEIGPGDSLGVGIAALLAGASTYYPIDKFKRDLGYDNNAILEELLHLFRKRAPIPDDQAFPKAHPKLKSYAFPEDLIPNMEQCLSESRLRQIREAVSRIQSGQRSCTVGDERNAITIYYPRENEDTPRVDLVVSNAVMEHVDDPEAMYWWTWRMVKPGGRFVHTIGLNSHGTASQWNGHWTYSDLIWRLIRGRTMYLINRWPNSWHVSCLETIGFRIDSVETYSVTNTLSRGDLAKRFRGITDEDLTIHSTVIVGHKLSDSPDSSGQSSSDPAIQLTS